jgi:D-alanyl-D-alanine carboxypeptidase/D-alanyl-D-alanine-endopeptidase (penicillin-binding protein 4)
MNCINYLEKIRIIVFICFIIVPAALTAQDTTRINTSDSLRLYSYATISEFHQQMDDIFNDQSFMNANWGVVIQSLETGEYFYKRNEDKYFVPASNMKLFTTAAGLLLLGNDYQFSTNVFVDGPIYGSTLLGDLVIQGRGDPTISGRFYNNDIYFIYDTWIDSLLERGVTKIKGNIIGDDNLFDELGLGKGWAWDYETDWYSAQSSAVSFNDNCVDITVYYQPSYDSIIVRSSPDLKNIVILNNVSFASAEEKNEIEVYRERGTNVINVYGKFKRNSEPFKTFATVQNPTQFAMMVLLKRLEDRGIKVTGYAIDIDDYDHALDYKNMKLLFSNLSNNLSEIIKEINKGSQNFFAEQLLKTIGLEKKGFGNSENGIAVSKELFANIGLNPENLIMVDGSGLSPLNMVTPRQIVELLKYMYSNKNVFTQYYNSLPIAGVDGTLGKRMKGTSAENVVRAKTGYISHVRSLSGYAATGDNEKMVFSIIANNFNVPVKLAENIQDLVCLRITNFRRK